MDGILGLKTMKELQMVINTSLNAVTYQGQHIRGMDEPMPMAPSVPHGNQFSTDEVTVSLILVKQTVRAGCKHQLARCFSNMQLKAHRSYLTE